MARALPKLPPHHWLFKNGGVFVNDPLNFCLERREEYGDFYEINVPIRKVMIVNEPEHIKYVLATNNKNYIKDRPTRTLSLSLGNGLLTSEGDFWRRQRRIAQPAFHKQKLELLLKIMVEETKKMLKTWAQKPGEIDLSTEFQHLTATIVTKALFGSEVGEVEEIAHAMDVSVRFLTKRFSRAINLPMWIPTPETINYKKESKILNGLIYRLIEERRKDPAGHNDLLSMLMAIQDEDTGERMSDQQLRDECATLFAAGHETTSNALSWTFMLLLQHPEILAKVEQEAFESSIEEDHSLKALKNLSYTSQVIQESMRLFPPAWAVGREAIEDDEIGGYHIPKGSTLLMHIFTVHRREDLWPEPEVFKPERFAPDAPKPVHRYAYFPFGGGPRLCIGNQFALMEMQVVIPMILRAMKLQWINGQSIVPEPLVTMKPKPGVMVKKSPR